MKRVLLFILITFVFCCIVTTLPFSSKFIPGVSAYYEEEEPGPSSVEISASLSGLKIEVSWDSENVIASSVTINGQGAPPTGDDTFDAVEGDNKFTIEAKGYDGENHSQSASVTYRCRPCQDILSNFEACIAEYNGEYDRYLGDLGSFIEQEDCYGMIPDCAPYLTLAQMQSLKQQLEGDREKLRSKLNDCDKLKDECDLCCDESDCAQHTPDGYV